MTLLRTTVIAGLLALASVTGASAQAISPSNDPARPNQRGSQGQSPTATPNSGILSDRSGADSRNPTLDPARPNKRGSQQAPKN